MGQAAPARPAGTAADRGATPDGGRGAAAGGRAAAGRSLEDVCEVDRRRGPLGEGAFGKVWRAKLKKGGALVAVKALDKQQMAAQRYASSQVESELSTMRECAGQPWIVQVHDFLETSGMYYFILEYCDGGTLAGVSSLDISDAQTMRFMRHLLKGIAFLHSRNICHRDVKPQNALLVGAASSDEARLKLGDFGFAVRLAPGKLLRAKLGTPAFMAPEIHLLPHRSAGYDHRVDTWAAGAVMVFLLARQYAFISASGRLKGDELLRGEVPIWSTDVFGSLFQPLRRAAGMSSPRPPRVARDLVRRLLMPQFARRLSARDALGHAWFAAGAAGADGGGGEDAPLLNWEDFEKGLADLEKDLEKGLNDSLNKLQGVVDSLAESMGLGLVQLSPTPTRAQKRPLARAVTR